jgi:UDP-N-acetylmuramoyl-L-alanyl-D-glutamate--2,6-diaminopimelate ligase
LKTPLIGRHNLANCLAAAAAGYALGYPIDDVFAAFRDAVGAPGRMERVKVPKGGPHVFVDYAHTPKQI